MQYCNSSVLSFWNADCDHQFREDFHHGKTVLQQRIPSTGMNTQCKYHRSSAASKCQFSRQSPGHCVRPRHQRGIPLLDAREAPEGNNPFWTPGHSTRGEYPSLSPRQDEKTQCNMHRQLDIIISVLHLTWIILFFAAW